MTEAEIKRKVWDFFALSSMDQHRVLYDLLSASASAGVVPATAPVAPPPPQMTEPAAEPIPAGTTTSTTDLGKQFEDLASKA